MTKTKRVSLEVLTEKLKKVQLNPRSYPAMDLANLIAQAVEVIDDVLMEDMKNVGS